MKLNNIRLLVQDFEKCFTFYSQTLGLKVTWGEATGNYASFDIGIPSGLCIFKSDFMAQAVGNAEKSLPDNHREKAAVILQVDNVDETVTRLKKRGLQFISEPADMTDWGIRTAHFRDPENNLFEIYSDLRD